MVDNFRMRHPGLTRKTGALGNFPEGLRGRRADCGEGRYSARVGWTTSAGAGGLDESLGVLLKHTDQDEDEVSSEKRQAREVLTSDSRPAVRG